MQSAQDGNNKKSELKSYKKDLNFLIGDGTIRDPCSLPLSLTLLVPAPANGS